MRLIINEMFELQHFDYEKLAKYIRCMFQAILGLDDASALQLIDQAIQIAREGKEVSKQAPVTPPYFTLTPYLKSPCLSFHCKELLRSNMADILRVNLPPPPKKDWDPTAVCRSRVARSHVVQPRHRLLRSRRGRAVPPLGSQGNAPGGVCRRWGPVEGYAAGQVCKAAV